MERCRKASEKFHHEPTRLELLTGCGACWWGSLSWEGAAAPIWSHWILSQSCRLESWRITMNHQVEQTHPCTIHLSGICGQGGLDSHGFPWIPLTSLLWQELNRMQAQIADATSYQMPALQISLCQHFAMWRELLWRSLKRFSGFATIIYNIKQSYHAQEHSLCILLPCQRLNQIGIGNRFLVFYCQEERDDEDLEASCQL